MSGAIEQRDLPLAPTAAGLRSGALSLDAYLDSIERRFSEREPEILAFVDEDGRFARLRREAAELARCYPERASRPPLFGVVAAVKDIFHVTGLPTQAGSRLPEAELAGPQGGAVDRLRAAGALILGKSATTEFAYFAPAATRNPRALDHTPGGSSSGSAAAVAAGLCPLALGTQTIGSISRPAAFCGVTGFKPTYGRIATAGVVPLSPSLDHVGFFVDRVADAELAAAVLCRDWQPAATPAAPRLGIPEGPYLERASPAGRAGLEDAVGRLEAAGLEVRRLPVMSDLEEIEARHQLIMAAEAAQVHGRWFATYRDLYHPKTAELIERGLEIPREALVDALDERQRLVEDLERPLAEDEIDFWLSPAATGAAPAGLESTGDPAMSLPWTQAGLPTVALPSGTDGDGLPLGVQLAGRAGLDSPLLAAAGRVEELLG